MKKSIRRLLSIFILMVLTLNFGISANAMTVDKVSIEDSNLQVQSIPDALNPIKEKEKLSEYKDNNEGIMMSTDEQIILTFDDGSRIEYGLEIEESVKLMDFTLQSVKTYVVTKNYYYGAGNMTVKLYAECTHLDRKVTIDRTYDSFLGSLAKMNNHDTTIIRATGANSTKAIGEAYGDFSFQITNVGEWLNRSYRFQIHVDPAGLASLVVLE